MTQTDDPQPPQSLARLLALPAAFVILVSSLWTILFLLVLERTTVGLILSAWVAGAAFAVVLLLLYACMRLLTRIAIRLESIADALDRPSPSEKPSSR